MSGRLSNTPLVQTALRLLAFGVLLDACSGGGSKDSTLTVPNTPVLSTVVVALSPTAIQVGQTSVASASGVDQNGNSIAIGTVVWSSGSPEIATASASGSATGTVTGVTPGQAQIIATSGGRQGVQFVTVMPVPVSSVTVSPAAITLGVGSAQQLTATLRDASGNALAGQTAAWTTSDATKSTVSQTGLVTAVALGSATITATSGGKTGTAAITIAVVPVASVTVSPANGSLVVGGTLTLGATALDANGNALTGQPFTWASTNLGVVSGTFFGSFFDATGVGAGTATITATAGGKSGTSVLTVTSNATSVTLPAAGQSAAFLGSPNVGAALTVQPGSQYLIAVVNTDPTSTSLEDFTLSTTFGAASSAGIFPRPVAPAANTRVEVPPARAAAMELGDRRVNDLAALRGQARNHLDVLEANRKILAQFGNPRDAWARARAQGGRSAPTSASVAQSVGVVNKVYVRKSLGVGCNAVDSISARTVAVGQHVIVLADTNRSTWPQTFRPDSSFYQTFADEFDQITYPTLLNFIGNPLALDATLSAIGKITVTITPELNNLPGVVGGGTYVAFVSACDFYPFVGSGPSTFYSNQTEMMYMFVPSATGWSVASWEAGVRATAAHESKHIISISDRALLGGLGTDEAWLEEGLAQVSSEIWERSFNQATWKGSATFAQTVGCEYNLSAFGYPCDAAGNKPLALMGSHLPFLFQYLQRESTSNSEGLAVDGQGTYGAGWALARWAIDQYASSGGEGTFIKSLINTTQIGLGNLSSHTGQSIPALLTYWNVATAIFQTPSYTAADVRTTFPSFNLANIFQVGQTGWTCKGTPCGVFANGPPVPVYPVVPIAVSPGTFSQTVHAVPGTSASFFLLSGSTAGIETLYLLNGTGRTLSASSGFRMLILRVQ